MTDVNYELVDGNGTTKVVDDINQEWQIDLGIVDSLQFNTSPGSISHSEGLIYYDSTNKCLAVLNDETDVVLQVGQEIWVRVYNDTGGAITNGSVCYLSGVSGTFPTIALADSSSASTCRSTLGFATHDIEAGTYGYITRVGTVRELNTAAYSAGELLYLSAATPGAVTNTEPDSPAYSVAVGNVGVVNATTGTIETHITIGDNIQGTIKFYNGSILEDHTTTVSSNGSTISLSLEQAGGGDLSLFFDGSYTTFDSTPAASVNLTAGTDTVPVLNYVYIPKDTNTLTANTTGFDGTQQIVRVATVLCQTAASAQTDGVYKHHAWTDHLSDSVGEGHVTHLNKWIRSQNATWLSGSALSISDGVATFDVSTTSGNMLQLHEHDTDAFNTATGSDVYIVNDSVTPYKKLGDLTTVVTDSAGVSMSGKYYNLVFWICGSEGSGNDKLFVNLPSGSYNTSSDAIDDLSGYTDYSIPNAFKGTGILIARATMRNQGGSGGTFTEEQIEDLRGTFPSNAGGGVGGGGAENFTDLLDAPSSYSGEGGKAVLVNSGETALEFVDLNDVFSNPNILINTNGPTPINQRGIADAAALTTGDYTVDRWYVTDDVTTVVTDIQSDGFGIELTDVTAGTSAEYAQKVESFADYQGKQVTLTAGVIADNATTLFIDDGVGTATSSAHSGGGTEETLTLTATIDASATKLECGLDLVIAVNNYARIAWIKLEEGAVATPWTVPDMAIEVDRCQRYYERLNYTTGGDVNVCSDGSFCRFNFEYKTSKRSNPSLSKSGTALGSWTLASSASLRYGVIFLASASNVAISFGAGEYIEADSEL